MLQIGAAPLACRAAYKERPRSGRHPQRRIRFQWRGEAARHFAKTRTPAPSTSAPGILVVVTGNFLHEHHDPAPQGGIINSHERSDQP
jgi:hypothetical protein